MRTVNDDGRLDTLVNVPLTSATKEQLRAAAKRRGTSHTQLARFAVLEWLERNRPEAEAAKIA